MLVYQHTFNSKIEALSQSQQIQKNLSPEEMTLQINAVKILVTAAHCQLVENKIERGASSDMSESGCRFDAFFEIPGHDAVITIFSIGSPDSQEFADPIEKYLLILFIDYISIDRKIKTLAIQTVKVPELVGEDEALALSTYTPAQLGQIAQLVYSANPINPEEYQSFFRRRKIPAGIET